MNRGTLRSLITSAGGGDLNLTTTQINSLIDQAITDIVGYLPGDKIPRLSGLRSVPFNLLQNGGFEINDGSNVAGWSFVGAGVTLDSSSWFSGKYSIKLSAGSNYIFSDMIPYLGESYPIAKGKFNKTNGGADIDYIFKWYEADKNLVFDDDGQWSLGGSTGWQTGTATAINKAKFLRFKIGNVTVGDVFVDDIVLSCSGVARVPDDSYGSIDKLYVDGVPARKLTEGQYAEISGSNQFLAPSAESPAYYVVGEFIRYGPTTAAKVEALYTRKPEPLYDDAQEPAIPPNFQNLIIPYVSFLGALAKGQYDEARKHEVAYYNGLASLLPSVKGLQQQVQQR